MKSNLKSSLLGVILAVFLSLAIVSAADNFSVTPETISVTNQSNQEIIVTLAINNTGTENLNFSLDFVNPTFNTNTIELELSQNEFSNITPGTIVEVNISFNTGNTLGTFEGEVIVSSDTETVLVPLNIQVTGTIDGDASVRFVNEGTTLRMDSRVDRLVRQTFTLENNGDLNLSDLSINIGRLESSSDSIAVSRIRFNGITVSAFNIEELRVNDEIEIEFEIDVPSNINTGTYRADFTIRGTKTENGLQDSFESQTFRLELTVTADDRVSFRTSDPLVVFGSAGELLRDIRITVDNDGNARVNDLRLVVVTDFEEVLSSNTFSRNVVSFNPSRFDILRNNNERIDMDINIPQNTPQGLYVATIEVQSANGNRLDELTLEVEVRGDIFIQSISGLQSSYRPGDTVDLEVQVRNQGNRLTRDIRVSGIIFDVTQTESDLEFTAPNFLLDRGQSQTVNLRFRLPDNARDGTFALEIRLNYEGNEVRRIQQVRIERPAENIVIRSASINPSILTCETTVSSLMRVENLGRFDTDIRIVSTIEGTSISQQSSLFELRTDESAQRSLSLDVSSLEPGTYTVLQRAITSEGRIFQETNQLIINDCGDNGVIIRPPTNDSTPPSEDSDRKIPFFGMELSPTTFFLGVGLAIVAVLIIISLFFL